jgi:hypothetical protein
VKNSHVTHSIIVSSSPPALYAKTGFPAPKASIGTIPKSSSPENMSHLAFWRKYTSSSPYFGPTKEIFLFDIFSRVSLWFPAQTITRFFSGI